MTHRITNGNSGLLAFVMGGGGARSAYQAGVLRYLSRRFPDLEIPIITGVSAGAINAAHLAAHHGTFRQAADELTQLWGELTVDKVFRTDLGSLRRHLFRWSRQLLSGGKGGRLKVRGLLDTQPLREYLTEAMHAVDGELTGIHYNLATGRLRAAALSTTNYSTGQSILCVRARCQRVGAPYAPRVTRSPSTHVWRRGAPHRLPGVPIGDTRYGEAAFGSRRRCPRRCIWGPTAFWPSAPAGRVPTAKRIRLR